MIMDLQARERLTVQHFLLIYDLKSRTLRDYAAFNATERELALAAYQQAEQAHGEDRDVEIVLIGADSIETVHQTHGHYFGEDRIAKYLSPA
jgi:hypothetical protein